MGHARAYDENGKCVTIISFPDCYRFKGFLFDYHRYLGPTRLKKNGDPSKRQGDKFYDAISEWEKLSKEEKEKTRA